MLICPHCRGQVAENPALAGQIVMCPHCAAAFQTPSIDPVPPAPLQPLVSGTVAGVHFRGGLAARRASRAPKMNPVVAGMLSLLFPGLGQFAQGRSVEGACFLIAAIIVIACGCLFPPAFLLGLVVLVWSIADAATAR